MIYFDNAATTYPKPDSVYEAVNFAMQNYGFNAGRGSYFSAEKTYNMINETRKKIADKVNTTKENVVFTSSATESLNLIINGLALTEYDNVFVSPFEHNSVIRALKLTNANIIMIPFDESWEVDENALNDLFIMNKPKAVIISHISNVTGFELPYFKIFSMSKKYNSINILDSAQGFGVYDILTNNVDFVVFAGHKSLYAMFGIAGFINLNNTNLKVTKAGGTGSDTLNALMPESGFERFEAGSINSIGIYSINKSLDFLNENNFAQIKHDLTQYFIENARKYSFMHVYLPVNYISKGIVSFNIEGFSADEVGMILAKDYDICVRTGYHCAPFIHDFIGSKIYFGTVRVSFSGFNTKDEIDQLFIALQEIEGEM